MDNPLIEFESICKDFQKAQHVEMVTTKIKKKRKRNGSTKRLNKNLRMPRIKGNKFELLNKDLAYKSPKQEKPLRKKVHIQKINLKEPSQYLMKMNGTFMRDTKDSNWSNAEEHDTYSGEHSFREGHNEPQIGVVAPEQITLGHWSIRNKSLQPGIQKIDASENCVNTSIEKSSLNKIIEQKHSFHLSNESEGKVPSETQCIDNPSFVDVPKDKDNKLSIKLNYSAMDRRKVSDKMSSLREFEFLPTVYADKYFGIPKENNSRMSSFEPFTS